MYTHILVPLALDNDDAAEVSVDIAQNLLDPDGTLTLLHIVETPREGGGLSCVQDCFDSLRDSAQDTLKMAVRKTDMAASTVVLPGHPARSILEYAQQNDVDCIILASHQPGISTYLLGSTAARVVRYAPCSVHVLRGA